MKQNWVKPIGYNERTKRLFSDRLREAGRLVSSSSFLSSTVHCGRVCFPAEAEKNEEL